MINLRLLGPVEATVNGGAPPPELLWRKHLALLAYLALAPDRRAGREQLAGLLWGDKPEAAARHSLAEAIRVIRKCTADGVEDVGTGYVRLADAAVETDTARFESLMEQDRPREAATLVTGELLEGFALADAWEFEEWLAGQRRAWRARSEQVLLAAAESELDEGSPAGALDLAGRALTLVPSSDTACQVMMRSHCLRGDRGQAMDAYARFSAWLDAELGIAPSAETETLAERVRSQRQWRLPRERTVREARGAESRRAPLIGRHEEMALLVRQWTACQDTSSPRTVLLAGDAGTGRSRLLDELLERVRLDGAEAVVVRALPSDRATPGAVLEGLARAAGLDGEGDGRSLVDVLGQEHSPLVLAVDDAGLADDASVEALVELAARGQGTVMIALAAARNAGVEPLERLGAGLGRDVPGTVIRLDPLGPDGLRSLAAWAIPDYDEADLERLVRRMLVDTAGYPLLAVELLHAVAHGLEPGRERPGWPAPGRTLDETRPGDLPETLVAAVRVGFRVLTGPAQRVLAAAAVLTPPVQPGHLAEATGLEGPDLDSALDELEWERWLAADARGYSFVARLVREIVAADLVTPGQRQRILDAASE